MILGLMRRSDLRFRHFFLRGACLSSSVDRVLWYWLYRPCGVELGLLHTSEFKISCLKLSRSIRWNARYVTCATFSTGPTEVFSVASTVQWSQKYSALRVLLTKSLLLWDSNKSSVWSRSWVKKSTCWVKSHDSRSSKNVLVFAESTSIWILKSPQMMKGDGRDVSSSNKLPNSSTKDWKRVEGGLI